MSTPSDFRGKIRRDISASVFFGPLKLLVPIVSQLLLYPIILSRYGLEVLGLWSLFTAVMAAVLISDLGFTMSFARECDASRAPEELIELKRDQSAVRMFYLVLAAAALVVIQTFGDVMRQSVMQIYDPDAFLWALIIFVCGAFVQLTAKIDSAVLMARNDNSAVQVIGGIVPVANYLPALTGAYLGYPIEGLAVGMLASGLALWGLCRWRLWRAHRPWQLLQAKARISEAPRQIYRLTRRSFHLYTTAIGTLLREPVFRALIAVTFGLEGVGIYDIAFRITRLMRELVSSGFYSLYPSFARLHRQGMIEEKAHIISVSLMILMTAGVGTVGILSIAPDFIFRLWLGNYRPDLIPATQILALWNLLTLANVPFWYLLLSTNHERHAARALWFHTISILLLPFISMFFDLTLLDFLYYWLVMALFTQGYIYLQVERRLGVFFRSLRQPLLKPIVFTAMAVGLFGPYIKDFVTALDITGNAAIAAILAVWFAILIVLIKLCFGTVRAFWKGHN